MNSALPPSRAGSPASFTVLIPARLASTRLPNKVLLPIDFANTKEALALNIETRKAALRMLAEGGAMGAVGALVGVRLGASVGCLVGESVGCCVGAFVGCCVGASVGSFGG